MPPVTKTNPVYFIYTQNNIPLVGGVTPQGVEIGLGNYKNIYSGKADDALLLLSISEFNPITTTKDAALGLSLIGVTSMPVNDLTASTKTRKLTPLELTQQTAATKLVRKLRVRYEIRSQIGDSGDLIADISKRVALLERMVMHYMDSVLNTTPIPPAVLAEYKIIIANYIADVKTGVIKDSIDLESKVSLVTKLAKRYTDIANIITSVK